MKFKEKLRHDRTSPHEMVVAARNRRREERRHGAWARSLGFRDGQAADSHYFAIERRIVAELEAEAAALGMTRAQLVNAMSRERFASIQKECHPKSVNQLFHDLEF